MNILKFAALFLSLSLSAVHAAPTPDLKAACTQLLTLRIADTTLTSSVPTAAGALVDSAVPGATIAGQPAHCLLKGEVGHHLGVDGQHAYGDRFELRLPLHWSGRLVFQGGGGLDGVIRPAIGRVASDPASSIPTALARGDAVVSTDAGHDTASLTAPGDFGTDAQAFADYAYDSTRRVLSAALEVTRGYYHRAPKHTYFMGCSTGGREGLIAAQRFPQLFDGVIAGSPAFHLTRAMVAEAWNLQAYATIAPKDAGPMGFAQALSEPELKLLAEAVLKKCDAADGVKDGLISDPVACHFDPRVLQCHGGAEGECLSAEKIAVIQRVFAGPADSQGVPLYANWFFDTGVAEPGWRAWMLGTEKMPPLNLIIAPQAMNGMALGLKPPSIDILHFDFDKDVKRIDAVAPALNAVSTDYAEFTKRGGKLLLYVGVSDPVFSASDLVNYFKTVIKASGGPESTAQFAQLYLVPGMTHCSGGKATDQFDTLSALQHWVEEGKRPTQLLAKGAAFPGRTRPLCPFPQVARYQGSGDSESASSFSCTLSP